MAFRGPWDDPSARRIFGKTGEVTGEPTGFEDASQLTVTFTNGTRTLALTPVGTTFTVWVNGKQYRLDEQTVTITDTEGLWYAYFNSSGVLTASQTFPSNLTDSALAWVGYWDATNSMTIFDTGPNELHGVTMDGATHGYLHHAFSTRWDTGLALGNMTTDADGSNNLHTTFGVSDGDIHDEDMEISIVDGVPQELSSICSIPMYYLSGATPVWRRQTESNYAMITYSGGSSLVAYNQYTGGAWQQTECGNTKFTMTHIFATNDKSFPIIGVQGQNVYNTKVDAEAGVETEIANLYTIGLPTVEWVLIATVLIQTSTSYTNAKKARYVTTVDGSDYVDWRFDPPMAAGAIVSNIITAGDSSVQVTDAGTGYIDITIDGTFIGRIKKSGNNLYITNPVTSGQVFIEGVDSGSDDSTLIGMSPNGAIDLYYNGTKEAETVSGGLRATNAFQIGTSLLADDILDEDDMASDSATALISQQSAKAYMDARSDKKNIIINGDMLIWQRETSVTGASDGDYGPDRFRYFKPQSACVVNLVQHSNVPTIAQAGYPIPYSFRVNVTTEDSGIGSGDMVGIEQPIEGYNIAHIMGKEITLSFWVYAGVTGTYCVYFVNNTDRSYVDEYTVNSADTWEFKQITLTMDDGATGTWDFTNGIGLRVGWTLMAGSIYQMTKGSWASSLDYATSSQVNGVQDTAKDYYLTGVQLEVGPGYTGPDIRPIDEELLRCQRYYEKSHNFPDPVGSGGSTPITASFMTSSVGVDQSVCVQYKAEKRTTPTVQIYDGEGDSGSMENVTDASDQAVSSISGETRTNLASHVTFSVDPGNNRRMRYDWTADAEF